MLKVTQASSLLSTYCGSAGAYSSISADSLASVRERPPHCKVDVLKQRGGADDASDRSDSDTWALDDISCHAPATLQHTETDRHGRYNKSHAGLHAEQYPAVEDIGDSAWEKNCSGGSGCTMTHSTSFVKHVGDQLIGCDTIQNL